MARQDQILEVLDVATERKVQCVSRVRRALAQHSSP